MFFSLTYIGMQYASNPSNNNFLYGISTCKIGSICKTSSLWDDYFLLSFYSHSLVITMK